MNNLIISMFFYFSIFFLVACDAGQNKKIDNKTNGESPSVLSSDINTKYFTYDDFKEIKKPFHDTDCNYGKLLNQNIELNFNNDYFYIYEESKKNGEGIDSLEHKEICLILNSVYVTAYKNNDIIFEKKIDLISKDDIDRNNLDGFDFTKKTSCGIDNDDNYGSPFIIEYRKINGVLSRKIIKNENFNFDCIIDENKKSDTEENNDGNVILENDKKSLFDFNQDGLVDKISLIKPAEMDDRNFNVTIEILKNTGNGYQKIAENAIMLEEPISGCGLDGLQEIWGDENNLNIIYQDCIDRKFATRNVSFTFDDVLNDFVLIKNEIEFSDADGNSDLHVCEVIGVGFSEFDGACY